GSSRVGCSGLLGRGLGRSGGLGRSLGRLLLGRRVLGGGGIGGGVGGGLGSGGLLGGRSLLGGLARRAGRLGRGGLGAGVAAGGGDGGLLGLTGEELALPLGQRLVGGATVGLRTRAGDQTLGDRVGHDPGEQADGADRVVVARDRVVDDVGIAVGVQDADDRDAQLARLLDGEVLLVGVDDPDRVRRPGHVADTAERLVELVALAAHLQQLLLGAAAARHVVEVDLVELLEAVDPLVH